MQTCGLFFVQAEDGIRDLVRSRGLGDVYKRQDQTVQENLTLALKAGRGPLAVLRWRKSAADEARVAELAGQVGLGDSPVSYTHLTLPTSDLV